MRAWPIVLLLSAPACSVKDPYHVDLDGSPGDDAPQPDGRPDASADAGPCVLRVAFDDGLQPETSVILVNANGSGMVNLSGDDTGVNAWPSSSPTGQVFFQSSRTGSGDIYRVEQDGSNLVNVSSNPAREDWPSVSPDGSKVLFLRSLNALWVMDADGSNAHAVATGAIYRPIWNPGSTRIAYQLQVSGSNTDIWVVNADGTGLTPLSNDPAADGPPAWSPDGARVAFVSNRGSQSDVWTMDSDDGGNLTNVTNDAALDQAPSFSPDGLTIAYSRDSHINLVPTGGGAKTPLTSETGRSDYTPRWSPDGSTLLFRRDYAGTRTVGVVPAIGGEVTILTGPSSDEYSDNAVWVACP